MALTVREDGAITVISVEGDLVIGAPETEFKKTVSHLLERGRTNLLIDLSAVRFLDSSGLGSLVRALTTSQNEGGSAKLVGVGPQVRKLLEMTKLDSVFEMYDNLESAASSF
jgi:anti-sigma B factor antagonist